MRISEKQFQAQVRELAELFGWDVSCWWRSFYSPKGFPDLFLMRGKRIVAAELKVGKNELSPAQEVKLQLMRETGKIEVYVWTPDDWEEIKKVLGRCNAENQ